MYKKKGKTIPIQQRLRTNRLDRCAVRLTSDHTLKPNLKQYTERAGGRGRKREWVRGEVQGGNDGGGGNRVCTWYYNYIYRRRQLVWMLTLFCQVCSDCSQVMVLPIDEYFVHSDWHFSRLFNLKKKSVQIPPTKSYSYRLTRKPDAYRT